MDSATISLILAVLGLVVVIVTEYLVDPGNRELRRVLGVFFMSLTIFFGGLGGILYLRDHNVFVLPLLGRGAVGTPTASLVSLSDAFNNAQNTPGFDTNLWFCEGCDANDTRIENGAIRFGIDGDGRTEVTSYAAFQPDRIQYLEGRLNLSEYEGQAGGGGVYLMLHTELSSGWWQTKCSISGAPSPLFLCTITKGVESLTTAFEYGTDYWGVHYGEWHTAKIELNPYSFELRFYLDDQLLGVATPEDANELKSKTFTTRFGIYSSFNVKHMVAYIDDIFLSTAP
jgi:hypothetical protein